MVATVSKLILSVSYALVLMSPALKAAKTFTLDLIEERDNINHQSLVRRQSGEGWRSTDIVYNTTTYQFYVEANVGDSGKNLKLAVIQNPFTWVAGEWNSTNDCPPTTQSAACDKARYSGFFNLYPPDSETYRNLSDNFDIEYADGRYVVGNWGRDKFRLGQLTIEDVNFGVGRRYNATPAIGLDRSDSTTAYPSFLEVMQEQGMINTPTYGIYVGDIRAKEDSGKSITFGGIDTAKFDRPLRTFSSQSDYALNLLSVDIVSAKGAITSTPLNRPETSPLVASLNFGTASIHLPKDTFDIIMDDLGALPSNYYAINSAPPEGSGLNFTFIKGFSVFVPYSQMLALDTKTGWYTTLIIQNDESIVLGTPFFRSTYVFYDFQNAEFSVARAKYNISASNVTEVGVNDASVRVNEWLYVADVPSETSPTPVPPSQTATPAPPDHKGPPIAAIVGGTVGGVALLAIIGLCCYFFFYRPRHRDAGMPPGPEIVGMGGPGGAGGMGGAPDGMAGTPGGMAMPQNNGFTNEQFSPTKPSYTSPVASPVSELSPNPWNRPENMAIHGVHGGKTVHELA